MTNPVFTYTTTDETHSWVNALASSILPKPNLESTEPVEEELGAVSVKVSFNRPLTWSEREAFRKFVNKKNREHEFLNDSSVVIWDFDLDPNNDESTRRITKDVAAFVATAYLNVHPRSAKSLYPEVIV